MTKYEQLYDIEWRYFDATVHIPTSCLTTYSLRPFTSPKSDNPLKVKISDDKNNANPEEKCSLLSSQVSRSGLVGQALSVFGDKWKLKREESIVQVFL